MDTNRTSQQLDTGLDISFGRDRDPGSLRFDPATELPELSQWYAASGSGSVRYRVGSQRRSIEARGRGYVNHQSNAAGSLFGGTADLGASTLTGRRRRNELSVRLQSSYEPAWVLGAFGPSGAAAASELSSGATLPLGIVEQQWFTFSAAASYRHEWSARNQTSFEYDFGRVRQFADNEGRSTWQSVSTEHSWFIRRSLSLVGNYSAAQNAQADDSAAQPPVWFQTVQGGLRVQRRLSRTRQYAVSMLAGATRLNDRRASEEFQSARPVFTSSVQVGLSRAWSLLARASRGLMVLGGASVFPVVNTNVGLGVTATPTRRFRYAISANVARAVSETAEPGLRSRTTVSQATAEMRYAFKPWIATFGSYSYYHHNAQDPGMVSRGFVPRYERHSLRIGVTLWAPLYGAF